MIFWRIDEGVATTWMVAKLSERIFITNTITGEVHKRF